MHAILDEVRFDDMDRATIVGEDARLVIVLTS
jgi:hypothetical protein